MYSSSIIDIEHYLIDSLSELLRTKDLVSSPVWWEVVANTFIIVCNVLFQNISDVIYVCDIIYAFDQINVQIF